MLEPLHLETCRLVLNDRSITNSLLPEATYLRFIPIPTHSHWFGELLSQSFKKENQSRKRKVNKSQELKKIPSPREMLEKLIKRMGSSYLQTINNEGKAQTTRIEIMLKLGHRLQNNQQIHSMLLTEEMQMQRKCKWVWVFELLTPLAFQTRKFPDI